MTEQGGIEEQLKTYADQVAEELEADVLLYNGDIFANWAPDEYLIDICEGKIRRDNVLLILVTR